MIDVHDTHQHEEPVATHESEVYTPIPVSEYRDSVPIEKIAVQYVQN